ncbi:MAG TPA: hypothetical protein DCL15_18940 [Chloroflexi bacterium]|nr:hypothetical protein [Chloroflexota bacterium]HHW87505.1 hypothetical protein [Chloroflexota bacterium]
MLATPFQAPLGIGQLLDRVFRLYRLRFGQLALTTAIFFVPLAVLSALLLGVAMSSYFDLLFNAVDLPTMDEETLLRASGATIGLSLLVAGLALMLGALAFLATLAQADATVNGQEMTVGASVRIGLSRFWTFVGWSLLVALIIVGILIVIYLGVFLVALVFAGLLAGLAALTGGNDLVAVGAFLLIMVLVFGLIFVLLLPLAFLATRWFVAPVVILTERCGPVAALRRSWRLTQGSFWRLFGLLILMSVLNGVVLSLPLTLIQFFAVILLTTQVLGAVNGVLTGLGYLVNILWYPFLALTLVLVYYDLRVRKENLDLELRIRALEMAVQPPTLPSP